MRKPTPKQSKLGEVQLQIMQVLWRRGQATAREITDELSGKKSIAHSTVQTLLRTLEAKGAVTHDIEDRTFVFRAVQAQQDVVTQATHDLLTRLFDRSVTGLMAHLLRHEKISSKELAELRQMIEEADQR